MLLRTPLFYACLGGMAHAVEQLVLEFRADPDQADILRQTPLHCAVFAGSLPCVQKLCELGARRAVRDLQERSPEDWAEARGPKSVADFFKTLH